MGKNNICHLEIGSASSDISINFIEPILPRQYENFIITDVCPEMVKFSKNKYSIAFPKTKYDVLDIETNNLPNNYIGQFDSLTCFYCLMWIKDQK